MKEYEIIKESVQPGYKNLEGDFVATGILKDKWYVLYYKDGVLENKELHSYDGVSGVVKEGYVKKAITLEEKKELLRSLVDKKTETLIFQGFPFDGKVFSMSVNAQINWSNFPMLPEAIFPLTILSKNDEEYILSYANKNTFYMTALGYKNSILQSGNALKKQIGLITTNEELENFIDNR